MAHKITEVNLPERTRARLQSEGDMQRVQKPHDLRTAIPLVDYTNPAKFPPYVFREYPKMPLLDGNAPIVIDSSGGVLVFYEAADEVEFKDMNPELADEIERNTPTKALADALAAKDAEIEDMRARLRAAGVDDAPKGSRTRLSDVVRSDAASKEDATGDAPPVAEGAGLRNTLPRTKANPLSKKKN